VYIVIVITALSESELSVSPMLPAFVSEASNQKVGIWGRSKCRGSTSRPTR